MAYDLVIIGGGPGGYNCAIRAGQLGLKTAIIENRGRLGGTCLNVGCIPSKALLHASDYYEAARKTFPTMGVKIEGLSLDLTQMMKLALEDGHTPEDEPQAFRRLLARAGHARSFPELRKKVAQAQAAARAAYLAIVAS